MLARNAAPLVLPLPGAVFLRFDVISKELFGVLIALLETTYTADVTARVYRTMLERARGGIAQRFSVIADAVFPHTTERDALSTEARGMDAHFRPIFLDADLAIRLQRFGSRRHDASDATSTVATEQKDSPIGRLD